MAGAFAGVTDLGAAFVELLKVVSEVSLKTAKFKSILKRLESTLSSIKPTFYEIQKSNKFSTARSEEETIAFIHRLEEGKQLILKCSTVHCWNVYKKNVYSNKLLELENFLLGFLEIDLQARFMRKTHRILSAGTNWGSGSTPGFCRVPELEELKRMVLKKDDTCVVVVSGPGGCGKTTLAKMLCRDHQIKGIFGDNIFYVSVSRMANLKAIVQKLFEHHCPEQLREFQNNEEAKNQLENLMRQTGSDHILLVLDDVWCDSESLIHNLKFQIAGYKILVTSRFVFPRFNSTYELGLLNDKDAKTLFCYSAFPHDGIPNVPDDLVSKIVKGCKGLPLALTVIGASLSGQPVYKWERTLKEWYEGQSIFHSHSDLFLSLKASVDALDELPIVKGCYLDMGSFPEDERIPATALMDMWVELYNLDEEGIYTLDNLLELSMRNLVKLAPTRKDATEVEGYCNEHFVTQHDLLRDLAIHLSNQAPVVQRQRVIMEIRGNHLPTWWIEQIQQPIHARLLSISTDEAFSSSLYSMQLPKLEVLILNFRSRNYTLPEFIERMDQLKVLMITNYGFSLAELNNFLLIGYLSNLRRIRLQRVTISSLDKPILELRNLRKISLIMCDLVEGFENCTIDIPHMLPNLIEIEIDRCDNLKALPSGLCDIVSLKKLGITYCHELIALPEGLGNLTNLEVLKLHSCTKLEELPESLWNLHNLMFLDISDCLSISKLPMQMGELSGLRILRMSGCRGLHELPTSVENLLLLEDVICDEETSYLWRNYEYDLKDLKINVVEEDFLANLMKVSQVF